MDVFLNWYFSCSHLSADVLECRRPSPLFSTAGFSSIPALTWHALKPASGTYGFGCDTLCCFPLTLMKAFFWNSAAELWQ